MLALYHSFSLEVAATYVLYLQGHGQSERLAGRALASCDAVGQPAELYPGFDGTKDTMDVPGQLWDQVWLRWIKLYDGQVPSTSPQVACALGHISLWAHCMTLDRPIVVLEHDAVMLKAYRYHHYPNTIAQLGWRPDLAPVWFLRVPDRELSNWCFLGGTHAYAIDPLAARRLFMMVMDRGIYAPIDVMMRMADVAIIPAHGHARPDDDGPTTVGRGNYGEAKYE